MAISDIASEHLHPRVAVQAMRGWEKPAKEYSQDEHALLRVITRSVAKVWERESFGVILFGILHCWLNPRDDCRLYSMELTGELQWKEPGARRHC